MATKKLIFIVDDSEIFSYMLSVRLEEGTEWEPRQFASGEEMLGMLDQGPDAIILDFYMDSENKMAMSGLEIMEMIRKKGHNAPVIIVSSVRDQATVQKLMEMGVHAFLPKSDDLLIDRIEETLQKILLKK